ncbi:hypothetical protein MMC12_008540 [Toensbergia leucococca]|nr:hypothetical protein [Toensbergia leucococca]
MAVTEGYDDGTILEDDLSHALLACPGGSSALASSPSAPGNKTSLESLGPEGIENPPPADNTKDLGSYPRQDSPFEVRENQPHTTPEYWLNLAADFDGEGSRSRFAGTTSEICSTFEETPDADYDQVNEPQETNFNSDAGQTLSNGVLNELDSTNSPVKGFTNLTASQEKSISVLDELRMQVIDWKGLDVEQFGRLVLHNSLEISNHDMPQKVETSTYEAYLFERVVICCKKPNVARRMFRSKAKQTYQKSRLRLKGRMFMSSITYLVTSTDSRGHNLRIFYKGAVGTDKFTMHFSDQSTRSIWLTCMEYHIKLASSLSQRTLGNSGSISTEA